MKWEILQVGSHIGAYFTDKVFYQLRSTTKAILIEPVNLLFKKLVQNCNEHYPGHNFALLNLAISNKIGTIKLYMPDIEIYSPQIEPLYIEKGLPQWTDQLASTIQTHAQEHNINLPVKEIKVPCITLNDIVEQYNITSLEQLYIDTEGHDYEVLDGLNLEKLKPKKIVFEHKHMEGTNKQPGIRYRTLMEKLLSHQYRVIGCDETDTIVQLRC